MLVSIDSPPPPLQYLCFLSFRTVVKGYLNLGNSQSNMSSSRGYYAFFLFEETKYSRVPIPYSPRRLVSWPRIVIQGGLAPVLQPLDKCLNKSFQENMKRKYLSWMIRGAFTFTAAGKKRTLSRILVLCWIKQSWREIPQEMLRKSFLTCGISNVLDGTEDDAIYKEEPKIHAEEDEMNEEFDAESKDEV